MGVLHESAATIRAAASIAHATPRHPAVHGAVQRVKLELAAAASVGMVCGSGTAHAAPTMSPANATCKQHGNDLSKDRQRPFRDRDTRSPAVAAAAQCVDHDRWPTQRRRCAQADPAAGRRDAAPAGRAGLHRDHRHHPGPARARAIPVAVPAPAVPVARRCPHRWRRRQRRRAISRPHARRPCACSRTWSARWPRAWPSRWNVPARPTSCAHWCRPRSSIIGNTRGGRAAADYGTRFLDSPGG